RCRKASLRAISRHRTYLMRRQSHVGMKHPPEDRALFALGPEQLLAVNLVIGDCLLAFVRDEPVDELLAKLLLHMRMLGGVNQDDTVLVEQPSVALHRDDEVGLNDELAAKVQCRYCIAYCQHNELSRADKEKRVGCDEQRIGSHLGEADKGCINVANSAGFQDSDVVSCGASSGLHIANLYSSERLVRVHEQSDGVGLG